MVNVQIFGMKNSQATRAAERFFKERRTSIQFVDLKQKPMAPGEIKRFVEPSGWRDCSTARGKLISMPGLNICEFPSPRCCKELSGNLGYYDCRWFAPLTGLVLVRMRTPGRLCLPRLRDDAD